MNADILIELKKPYRKSDFITITLENYDCIKERTGSTISYYELEDALSKYGLQMKNLFYVERYSSPSVIT